MAPCDVASNARQTLLSGAVSTKINSTEKIMNTLQAELAGVQRELAKAAARQAELEAALAEKVEPLVRPGR